jgi:hypothetical protein
MLDFINKLFSSGFMSIFSAALLASSGLIQYLISGRQMRAKFEEAIKNKEIKEIMLERLALLNFYTKELKIKENTKKKINDIESEIRNLGAVAACMPYFWEEKSKEIQKIYDLFDSKFYMRRKRFKRKLLFFFLLISISIYIYIGASLHSIPFNFNKLLIWISLGLFTTLLMSIFFYFYVTLYLFTLKKVSHFLVYIPRPNSFFTSYGITKLFFYGCIIMSYFFYSNIYKYIFPAVFPMFSDFVSKFISLIIIVTEVVSAIGGYLQIYEFAEKRIFKKEASQEEI